MAELERLRAIEAAAREMLRHGEHDGPCDNLYEDGTPNDDPCSLHIAATETRHRRLAEALGE